MRNSFKVLSLGRVVRCLILLATSAGPFAISSAADFDVDLEQIETNVEQAKLVASKGKGLISDIAAARLETLLLTKALLQNRKLADSGSDVTYIEIPTTEIDTTQADAILADINQTISDIENTEVEVESSGGLIQVLAVTRLETERLTLAQLKLAYYQAAYGIAVPLSQLQNLIEPTTAPGIESEDEVVELAWADPRYPAIDYSLPIFRQAQKEGVRVAGWWTIHESKAAIDDSPLVVSYNQSLVKTASAGDDETLVLRCKESESALIYIPGEFVTGMFGEDHLEVTHRIDGDPARSAIWSELTSNKGAGLFGPKAEVMMRAMYKSSNLFLRLRDQRQSYDSLFELAGVDDAIDAIADACGWTPLQLTKADYRAIQSILKTAGYSVGIVDGVWGRGSRKAMKSFQEAAGLSESGAPNVETLAQLGYDPSRASQERVASQTSKVEVQKADSKQTKPPQENQREQKRELLRLRNLYLTSIRQRVERNWRKPLGTSSEVNCTVSVIQSVAGEVLGVDVESCEGGTEALRKSVENAVRVASPLPVAPDPKLFNRNLKFFFKPK